MKKLQVMIEDEQMKDLKRYALENDVTLKEIVAQMIENFFNSPKTEVEKPKTEVKAKPEPKEEEKPQKPSYNPDEVFVVRKTHKTLLEKANRQYHMYGVMWLVWEGCKSHYDKDGNIIPFRITTDQGEIIEVDEDYIEELEKATGKKVVFE